MKKKYLLFGLAKNDKKISTDRTTLYLYFSINYSSNNKIIKIIYIYIYIYIYYFNVIKM